MELGIAVIALALALWQLKMQRDESRANSRLNALIHIAELLRAKIEHYERIIDSVKIRSGEWASLANRVNNELRPLLAAVNAQLIDSVARNADGIDVAGIRQALRLGNERGAP